MKRAARYISEENDRILNPNGIFMLDPMEKGLRCVRDERERERCSAYPHGSFRLDRSLYHQWSSMIEISLAEINGMHKEIIEQSRQTCVCALINHMRYPCSSPMSNSVHEIHCTVFPPLGIDFYEGKINSMGLV